MIILMSSDSDIWQLIETPDEEKKTISIEMNVDVSSFQRNPFVMLCFLFQFHISDFCTQNNDHHQYVYKLIEVFEYTYPEFDSFSILVQYISL